MRKESKKQYEQNEEEAKKKHATKTKMQYQNVPRLHSTIAAPQTTPKAATQTLPSSASVLGILIDIAAEDGVLVSGATGRVLVTVVTMLGELITPGELVPGGIVTVVPARDVALELEVKVVDVDEEEVLLVVAEAVVVGDTTVVTVAVDTGGGELMVVVNVVVKDSVVLVRVLVRVVPVVVPAAVVEVERVTEEDETDFVRRKSIYSAN